MTKNEKHFRQVVLQQLNKKQRAMLRAYEMDGKPPVPDAEAPKGYERATTVLKSLGIDGQLELQRARNVIKRAHAAGKINVVRTAVRRTWVNPEEIKQLFKEEQR